MAALSILYLFFMILIWFVAWFNKDHLISSSLLDIDIVPFYAFLYSKLAVFKQLRLDISWDSSDSHEM